MPLFRRANRPSASPEEAASAATVVTPRHRALRYQAVQQARRARREFALVLPLIVAVLLVYTYRDELPGPNVAVRIVCAIALVILGYAFARDVGRATAPMLLSRLEPATAGTVGFLLRLGSIGLVTLVALRVAGLRPETLAVGGALTAVVVGLAAQQTLSNLIAGLVLISARPFIVGDRLKLQGGGLAGTVEGDVIALGLLHTTLASGDDRILVPNSVVLGVAIVPLREPARVDLRARLEPGLRPSALQALLDERVTTPTRGRPHIALEEVDDDEVIMRVSATPADDRDGPRLADEVLATLQEFTHDGVHAGGDAPGAGDAPGGDDPGRAGAG